MKNNFSIPLLKILNVHPPHIKEIQRNDAIVKSGIKELDKFIDGFKSGEINFIEGYNKIASDISNKILAHA